MCIDKVGRNNIMETKVKERQSNIELLRIILMFAIILHHLIYHNYLFIIDHSNHIIAMILYSGAKVAVICFILIMGYFSLESKFNIKKIITLILELLFYELMFSLIFLNKDFTINEFMKNVNQYWFINVYLIIYLLSPIIKKYIINAPKILQIFIIIIMFIIALKYPRTRYIKILWFAIVFICGAYTKKYLNIKNKFFLLLVVVISYSLIVITNEEENLVSILNLICAIFLLLLFSNIKIKPNSLINNISKYTLGIYLVHDNVYVREFIIQQGLFMKEMFFTDVFIIYTLIIAILIYFVSLVIDYIRNKAFQKILFKSKKLNIIYDKINNYINKKVSE